MWMKLGVGAVEQVSGMIHARTGRCEGIEGVEARQTSHQNLGLLGIGGSTFCSIQTIPVDG